MNEIALKRLAFAVAAFNAALLVAGATLVAAVTGEPIQHESWGFQGAGTLYGLSIASVGFLIASRLPRNPIGWMLTVAGVFGSFLSFGEGYVLYGVARPEVRLPGFEFVNWVTAGIWIPMMGFLTYMLLLFPTGTLPSRRWRKVAWALPFAILVALGTEWLSPGQLDSGFLAVENPYPLEFLRLPLWVTEMAPLPLVLCMFAAAGGIAIRMKRARGDERAQLKWLAYGGFMLGITLIGFALATSLAPQLVDALEIASVMATVGIPVATGTAIVKYRLYDIDVIINRTLVYGALSAVLAGTYFGLVVAFQGLLQPVTRESDIAVAASTLAVAALFGPLRRYIQRFIDRRFYRSRYDAQETLESFSARLRDEVELTHLSAELLGVVATTMRPRHASLWLRSGESR